MIPAAANLVGEELPNGWKVTKLVTPPAFGTGGSFSYSYEVVNESNKKAFLKALDFSSAQSTPDPARTLQAMTEAFNYERDLLTACGEKKLSRVVKALEDGKVNVQGSSGFETIQYIIFEKADGDVHRYFEKNGEFNLLWICKTLHGVATGIRQLHGIGIAHQDIKPSNVLLFDEDHSKISDMGCASQKNGAGPRDHMRVAGDPTHAPPEFSYNYIINDWSKRRAACDLYHLGSLAVYFVMYTNMNAAMFAHLPRSYHPAFWGGEYNEVLPYLRESMETVVSDIEADIPEIIRNEFIINIRYLCEPDPSERGHPLERLENRNKYSLEKFISSYDLMAKKLEYSIIK